MRRVTPIALLAAGCWRADPVPTNDIQLPPGLRAMPESFDCARSRSVTCYVAVPGGTFFMGAQAADPNARGYDPVASPGEGPVHEVAVAPFWMQKHEVSTSVATRCVESGACQASEIASGQVLLNLGTDRHEHPINGATWEGARQLCAWIGARMPTEAEWELAARGTDGRRWPWGNDAACPTVGVDPKQPWELGHTAPPCVQRGTLPFNDLRGPSPYDVTGMAGSVWEWVADWYAEDAYAQHGRDNPTGPASGSRRVQRGGGWMDEDPHEMRTTNRIGVDPASRVPDVGVRCVWSPAR